MSIAALLISCIFMIVLYSNQEKMIFFPQTISQSALGEIKKRFNNVEDITIKSNDGTQICGWLAKAHRAGKPPLLMYFGGNAEEVSYLLAELDNFEGYSLALMNYRGYGLSRGKPGEKALFGDAIAAYDYFSQRDDVDNENMVVMGRSLGSGVAVYLAQNRPVKGVILVTPYDSITSVAHEQFPYLPVSLLLKHHFDSVSRAPFIKAPLLALVAGQDDIIRPHHAKRLVERWGGPYTLKLLDNAGHNTIDSHSLYWPSIKQFLRNINSAVVNK